MVEVLQNFDWSITSRKATIFIPHYDRPAYVEASVKHFSTNVPKEDWVIIIGNDSVHHNFDYLTKYNAYTYTILRETSGFRNSGSNRNYALKRCQSDIFIEKDPEVFVVGDFLSKALSFHPTKGWRAGKVILVGYPFVQEVLENGLGVLPKESFNFPVKGKLEVRTIVNGIQQISIEPQSWYHPIEAHKIIADSKGATNFSSFYAYVVGFDAKLLQKMRGYSEDYWNFGWEDCELFVRLMSAGYPIEPDYECISIHLEHPLTQGRPEDVNKMGDIFAEWNPNNIVVNKFRQWGQG